MSLPQELVGQTVELEQAALGSLLLDPSLMAESEGLLEPADFYRETHSLIYVAMRQLYRDEMPVDFALLVAELERRGQLEAVGGAAYLTSLIRGTPTSSHFVHYAHQVREQANRRRLISSYSELYSMASSGEDSIEDMIKQTQDLLEFVDGRVPTRKAVSEYDESLRSYWDLLDRERRGEVVRIPFGFRDVDWLVGGLKAGDFCIIGGRASHGKTTFALQAVWNLAKLGIWPVVLFSVESTEEELAGRVAGYATNVFSNDLRKGRVSLKRMQWARGVGEKLQFPFLLKESYDLTPASLDSALAMVSRDHEVALVIVDYLHNMQIHGRFGSRVEEEAAISSRLKGLAVKHKVPLLAISQVRKPSDAGRSKRPSLPDLMGSSALGYDADVVLILFWAGQGDPTNPRRFVLEVEVAKHRDGPTGVVYLARHGQGQLSDLRHVRPD